jgi:nucleotide-binding universal stress UspA family protein
VDGSENAALAARRAAALAGATGAELHVASVGEHHVSGYYEEIIKEGERQAQEVLAGQVERIEEAGGAISATHVRVGQPAAEIVALGEELEADLLVVGDRGLSGLRRILMGSVADSVVRYAHCPVLMVRDQVGGK